MFMSEVCAQTAAMVDLSRIETYLKGRANRASAEKDHQRNYRQPPLTLFD